MKGACVNMNIKHGVGDPLGDVPVKSVLGFNTAISRCERQS